jgi:hypothetical protein
MDRLNGSAMTNGETENDETSTALGAKLMGPTSIKKGRKLTKRDFLALSIRAMGPTDEEKALLAALRALRTAELKPFVVPDALLEHGYVTKRRAAKLLGTTLKEVDAMTDRNRWRLGGHVPLLKNGTIPISELRRELSRRRRQDLKKLAEAVVNRVTTEGVPRWEVSESAFEDASHLHGIGEVAECLALSKAAVVRLIEDDDDLTGLLGVHHPRLRGWYITTEELEAYARKLGRVRVASEAA